MKPQVSNLDKNRTSVIKRGVTVCDSYGFRFRVERVRMGQCVVAPINVFGHVYTDKQSQLPCSRFSVVRS